METKTRVLITFLVLAGSAGILCVAYLGLRKWYNYTPETSWIVESEEEDTTERHRQNMQETYQILPDHILFRPNQGEGYHGLVRVNRKGKRRKVILDEVSSFLELDQKIYYQQYQYYSSDEDMLNRKRIYCYDESTEESTVLVEEPDQEIIWFTIYGDQILYVCDNPRHDDYKLLTNICLCGMDGKNKKIVYDFRDKGRKYEDIEIFLAEDTLVLLIEQYNKREKTETIIDFLSLLSGTYKEVGKIDQEYMACAYFLKDCLYVSCHEKFYKIPLDFAKGHADVRQVSLGNVGWDVGYTIYCRDDELYGDNLRHIVYFE